MCWRTISWLLAWLGAGGCLSLPALSVFCVSRRPLLLLARAVYWTGAGPGEGTQRGSAELRTAKQNVSSSVETGTDITILHTLDDFNLDMYLIIEI